MKKTLSLFLAMVMLICSFGITYSVQAATKAPKTMSVSSASLTYDLLRKKCYFKASWKRQKGVSGYQVKLGTEDRNGKVSFVKTKTLKGSKKTSLKVYCNYENYESQYCVVKIRAYKTKKKKKIYGKWSKEKDAKFKTINELKGFKGKILSRDDNNDYTLKLKLTWKSVKGADGYQVVYRNINNYYKTTRFLVKNKKTTYTGWFKEVGQVTIRPYRVVKGKRVYGEFSYDYLDYTPDVN